MSIVASVAGYNILEPDGSRLIREKHTDHLGHNYFRYYHAAPGHDVNAALAAYADTLEVIIAEMEADQVLA